MPRLADQTRDPRPGKLHGLICVHRRASPSFICVRVFFLPCRATAPKHGGTSHMIATPRATPVKPGKIATAAPWAAARIRGYVTQWQRPPGSLDALRAGSSGGGRNAITCAGGDRRRRDHGRRAAVSPRPLGLDRRRAGREGQVRARAFERFACCSAPPPVCSGILNGIVT
jgi:hypothetical protein